MADDKALVLTREELQQASGELMTLQDRLTMAKLLQTSGYFPDIKSTAQAFAKIQAGHELGLGPMTALREINIMPGGRPTLSAHIMAVLIMRSQKYQYRVLRSDAVTCILAFDVRESRASAWVEMGQEEFSMDMARRAKIYEKEEGASRATQKALADKWNYQSWASDMLYARAMSRGAKKYCAEVFGGAVYLPDEVEKEDADRPTVTTEQAQKNIADLWGENRPLASVTNTALLGGEHDSQTETEPLLRDTLLQQYRQEFRALVAPLISPVGSAALLAHVFGPIIAAWRQVPALPVRRLQEAQRRWGDAMELFRQGVPDTSREWTHVEWDLWLNSDVVHQASPASAPARPQEPQDAPQGIDPVPSTPQGPHTTPVPLQASQQAPQGMDWRHILPLHLADLPEALHEACVVALGDQDTPEGRGLELLSQVLDVLNTQTQEDLAF